MQFVNDTPVANSQSIAVTPLQLGDVVVTGIGIDGNFLDFRQNSPLQVRRKTAKLFSEGLGRDDRIHIFNCYLG